MGVERMVGIPWHVEKMARKYGDPRRHRSRCIYFTRSTSYCSKVCGKCRGAAHCDYYEEDENVKEQIEKKPKKLANFEGVKMIFVADIWVKRHFHLPSQEKVDAVIKHYKEYGEIDKPIVVSCDGSRYILEDKYLRYYVAKKLGLQKIPAKIGNVRESKLEDRLRKVGTKVKHSKYGDGKVMEVTDRNVTILFDSGKEVTFNIEMCIKKQFVSLL